MCDILADPFLEQAARGRSVEHVALGCRIRFTSTSEALLALVEDAYAGLPHHVFPGALPTLQIELRLMPRQRERWNDDPPPLRMQSGAGLLCGTMDTDNYLALSPATGCALIVVSEDMLAFPYHLRYELIEFAVFTLATRALGLIPLHAACLGLDGQGVLIMGASGAGKSTLALQALLEGLDFVAEDAVFVHAETLRATGVPNYAHVRPDGVRWVDDERHRGWIDSSPMIQRRSGVAKLEVDLRKGPVRLAASPLALLGIVFVRPADEASIDPRLHPISTDDLCARLLAEQPYAASQHGWENFVQRARQLKACELIRGRHPTDSVRVLRQWLR